METLSYLVLILLTLFGYSAGITALKQKTEGPEPQLLDIFVVLFLWAAALTARSSLSLNKWLVLLPAVCVSFTAGLAVSSLRREPSTAPPAEHKSLPPQKGIPARKQIWKAWTSFSKRAGGFQSRMLLSYTFFIVVFPFALIVKVFSDPLHLKIRKKETHWQERKSVSSQLEDYRRQF